MIKYEEKIDFEKDPLKEEGCELYSMNALQFASCKRKVDDTDYPENEEKRQIGGFMKMDDTQRGLNVKMALQKKSCDEIWNNADCEIHDRTQMSLAKNAKSAKSKEIINGDSQHRFHKLFNILLSYRILHEYFFLNEESKVYKKVKEITEEFFDGLNRKNSAGEFERTYTDPTIDEKMREIATAVRNKKVIHELFPTNKNGDIKYKEKDSPKPDERLLNTLQYCTFLVSKKICEEVGMEHLFDKNHSLNDKQKKIVENVLNKYIYGMTNTSIVEIFCKDKQSLRSKSFTDDGRFKQTTDPADQMNNIFWLSCGYSEYATIMLEIDEIFEMSTNEKDAKETAKKKIRTDTDKKKIRTTFVKDVLIAYEMQDRTVDSEKHRSTINSKNFIGALEATIGTQSDEFIAFLKDCIAFLKEVKCLNSTANSNYSRKRSKQPKLYMLPIILSKFCFGIEKLDILPEMLECLIQKDENENKSLMPIDKITTCKALKNLDKFLSVLVFEKIKGIFLKEAAPLNHQFIIPKIKVMVENRARNSKDDDFLKLLFSSFYKDQKDKRRKSVSTTDFLKIFKNVASYDANIADGSKLNVFDKKNIQSAYTVLQISDGPCLCRGYHQ